MQSDAGGSEYDLGTLSLYAHDDVAHPHRLSETRHENYFTPGRRAAAGRDGGDEKTGVRATGLRGVILTIRSSVSLTGNSYGLISTGVPSGTARQSSSISKSVTAIQPAVQSVRR